MYYYVYVLESKKDQKFYTGCTNNLQRRLHLHNTGQVFSTKNRYPLKLIYCEVYLNQKDAFSREQVLKTGWGRNYLKKVLSNYLKGSKNLGG